jgi:hypothetical protein
MTENMTVCDKKCDIRKISFLILPFLLVFSFLSCSANYGRIVAQWGPGNKKTIRDLAADWDKYLVYYAGPSFSFPSAVIFDPKEDGRKLIPDKWLLVKDRAQLDEIVEWLEFTPIFKPILFTILGPDGKPYGYLYSHKPDVLIKAIGNDTLWVSDIPLPPISFGGVPERR